MASRVNAPRSWGARREKLWKGPRVKARAAKQMARVVLSEPVASFPPLAPNNSPHRTNPVIADCSTLTLTQISPRENCIHAAP